MKFDKLIESIMENTDQNKIYHVDNEFLYLGNDMDDRLVAKIFGSASEFAHYIKRLGNEFTWGNLEVRYDVESDTHSFYMKTRELGVRTYPLESDL